MKKKKVPKSLQAVLWSVDVNQLDVKKDKIYIINQVLSYGTLDDIRWLLKNYPREEIKEVFLKNPIRNYPKESYYFAKNIILGLNNYNIDKNNYVTSISGPLRQRASENIQKT